MDPTHEFHRPDKPHLPGYSGRRAAGVVLMLLGLFTSGSTCPFAVVLCAEWLFDPRRTKCHRDWDLSGLVWSIPGVAWWLFMSFGMAMTYRGAESLFVAYWSGFALWLIVRVFTRWREISALRRLDGRGSAEAIPTVYARPPDEVDVRT